MTTPHSVHFDRVRTTAIVLVVLLHTSAQALAAHPLASIGWWAGNVLDALSRPSVPLFFMISGALLLPRAQPPFLEYAQRRLSRIVPALLVWSVIYFAFRLYYLHEALSWGVFPRLLLNMGVFFHLYFLYYILFVYLLIYLLGPWIRAASTQSLVVAVALWMVFGIAVLVCKELHMLRPGILALLKGPLGLSGYALLGYMLSHRVPAENFTAPRCWTFWALGFLITAGMTFLLSMAQGNGQTDIIFYAYIAPNVMVMAAAIFLLLRTKGRAWHPEAALGIYLIHPLIMRLLMDTANRLGFAAQSWPVLDIAGLFTVTLVLSSAIVLLLRRVQMLRKIV